MGVGVGPVLNATQPTDYPSTHPLSKTAYYWTPWASYIFNKMEGKLDTLGSGPFDHFFVYHSGKDESFQEASFSRAFSITKDNTTRITIQMDHRALLMQDGAFMNIKDNPVSHANGPLNYPKQIVENISEQDAKVGFGIGCIMNVRWVVEWRK